MFCSLRPTLDLSQAMVTLWRARCNWEYVPRLVHRAALTAGELNQSLKKCHLESSLQFSSTLHFQDSSQHPDIQKPFCKKQQKAQAVGEKKNFSAWYNVSSVWRHFNLPLRAKDANKLVDLNVATIHWQTSRSFATWQAWQVGKSSFTTHHFVPRASSIIVNDTNCSCGKSSCPPNAHWRDLSNKQ